MFDVKCRVSVIGAGHLGKLHTTLLKQVEGAELAGVFDTDKIKAQTVAQELKCRAFASLEEALSACQAVIIASTTSSHAEVALSTIAKGVHCLVEKPLADTSENARKIAESANRAGVKIQVGHIERFNRAFKALEGLKLIPRFIEVHRLAAFNPRGTDVAVVQDLMIHDLDLILKMVNSPVKEIHASGVEVVSGGIDIANARIIFQSGCVANVTASRLSAKKMRKMRIFQRDGYISLDFITGEVEIFKLEDPSVPAPKAIVLGAIDQGVHKRNIVYLKPETPPVNAIVEEQKAFVASILHNKPIAVTAEEAISAIELGEQILAKIAESAS